MKYLTLFITIYVIIVSLRFSAEAKKFIGDTTLNGGTLLHSAVNGRCVYKYFICHYASLSVLQE